MTAELAITVVGRDRPGIIADITEVLAGLGLNLTDSTMTLLRAHFAMMLICDAPVTADTVEAALQPLAADGTLLITVREVAPETAAGQALGAARAEASARPTVLTVHGADRLGIVAAVTRVLAAAGGNITDLTTRLSGSLYVLVAEVDLPSTVDVGALTGELTATARRLGVEVSLRAAEVEVL